MLHRSPKSCVTMFVCAREATDRRRRKLRGMHGRISRYPTKVPRSRTQVAYRQRNVALLLPPDLNTITSYLHAQCNDSRGYEIAHFEWRVSIQTRTRELRRDDSCDSVPLPAVASRPGVVVPRAVLESTAASRARLIVRCGGLTGALLRLRSSLRRAIAFLQRKQHCLPPCLHWTIKLLQTQHACSQGSLSPVTALPGQ